MVVLDALSPGLAAQRLAETFGGTLRGVFLSPGSQFSLFSLGCALVIAAIFLVVRKRRFVRPRALIRALLPRRILFGPSARADWGFFVLNSLMAGVLFGWAILSAGAVSGFVAGGLAGLSGRSGLIAAPAVLAVGATTVLLFLAYEFGYWLQHWMCHRIPALWAFHKVHHTAETLSPVTTFRVHPVDTVFFANVLALTMGTTGGVMAWLFGRPVQGLMLGGTNIILVGFLFLLIHLQHSHIWIAFRGVWGRLIISPAHHQIHHSSDPADFDSNFGSCLAIWDWMFGTLRIPEARRRGLKFGAVQSGGRPHSVTGGLITPFAEAVRPAGERAPSLVQPGHSA